MELFQNEKVANRYEEVPLGAFLLPEGAFLSHPHQGLELSFTSVNTTKTMELFATKRIKALFA